MTVAGVDHWTLASVLRIHIRALFTQLDEGDINPAITTIHQLRATLNRTETTLQQARQETADA